MSAGPIAQERASHTPPRVSTSEKERRCAAGETGRGYCGRKSKTPETDWSTVTCADCRAAHRADQQAGEADRWNR